MTDTKAATTAAHNARMTASFSNSTRLVKTRAELAPMASTSNTVSSNQPGLRPLRRERVPRDRSVMGRLYPPQVTSRVDRFGDSADGRGVSYSVAPLALSGGSSGDLQQC